MYVLQNFVPLAHGELGYTDEVIPLLLVGTLAIVMVIVGVIGRNRDQGLADDSADQPVEEAASREQHEPDADDHYRLD
jgi:hypothetical protein